MDERLPDAIARPWTNGYTVNIIDIDKQHNAMTITFNGGISTDKETEQGNELLHHLHLFSTLHYLGVLR